MKHEGSRTLREQSSERRIKFQRCLVTGGSSGIGRCICLLLAARGLEVISASNVPRELAAVAAEIAQAGGRAQICDVDLSQPDQLHDLIPRLEDRFGAIDVLVNNAGIGYHTELIDLEPARLRTLFEVNFFATVLLSQQALRAMAARGWGHIVNVSSASARVALRRMCAYGASKGAVHSFTQSLRLEAAARGVRVSEVLPISVSTPFFERAGYRPKGKVQTPEQVAELVWRCLREGRAEICSDWMTSWGFVLEAMMPNLVARLLRRF